MGLIALQYIVVAGLVLDLVPYVAGGGKLQQVRYRSSIALLGV